MSAKQTQNLLAHDGDGVPRKNEKQMEKKWKKMAEAS
jgi:hypothetical protein